jgi:hypothetical protein
MGKKRKKKNKKAKRINENNDIANTSAKSSSAPVVETHKDSVIKPVHIILVIVIAVLAYVYLYSGLI